jgi:hypothetical protein
MTTVNILKRYQHTLVHSGETLNVSDNEYVDLLNGRTLSIAIVPTGPKSTAVEKVSYSTVNPVIVDGELKGVKLNVE